MLNVKKFVIHEIDERDNKIINVNITNRDISESRQSDDNFSKTAIKAAKMKLFVVFVLLALLGLVLGEGYWNIQLSPQSIASVPYGSGNIAIWQHANDKERYYAMPLVYLLNESARVRTNIVTGITEMSFDVLLWSEEARESVYLYLKREFNSSISQSNIEMLPMEKIRIVWKDTRTPISSHFQLVNNWKSNTHLPSTVRFKFTCDSGSVCEGLLNAMKDFPEDFNSLEMEYIINGQRSARRILSVTGRHVMQGRLWTKMATMTGAGNTRYLTADDLKTVTSESVSNVLGSLVRDSDYVDTGDEVNMNDVLHHELSRQQVSTTDFQPQQWDSVFWDPAWARPDKLTRSLNQVYEKDASDSRSFSVDEEAGSRSAEGAGGASFLELFGISGSGGSSSSSQSRVQKEDVLNTLRERHSNVEWTGEQFRVKPMTLYRLNLSTLNTSNNVATANVQVRRYESVHSIKLRVAADSAQQTPSLTPQLVESRLLQKLDETKSDITEQTDNKLQSQNTRLTNMLQSQSTRLTNTINVKDNEGKARLVPIQRKLATLPGWPAGKYCILRDYDCPPGFGYRDYGSIYGITASVTGGSLGDSYISNDGGASIYLSVCCR